MVPLISSFPPELYTVFPLTVTVAVNWVDTTGLSQAVYNNTPKTAGIRNTVEIRNCVSSGHARRCRLWLEGT
jgi:hypothetical protein